MPCRHPARTIPQDRADAFPLPGPTDRAHLASRSTRLPGAARPRRGTLLDRPQHRHRAAPARALAPATLRTGGPLPRLPRYRDRAGLLRPPRRERRLVRLPRSPAPHRRPRGPAALPQPRQDGARLLRAPALQRHLRRRHPRPGLVLTGPGPAASANPRLSHRRRHRRPGMAAGDGGGLRSRETALAAGRETHMTQLVYAGIGSRATPRDVLETMTAMAAWLARRGWHLHTGGAAGADSAFAAGAPPGTRSLFLPWPRYRGNAGPDCRTLAADRMRALPRHRGSAAPAHGTAARPPRGTCMPETPRSCWARGPTPPSTP